VTRARGGRGAVREVVELLLRAQGRWERLVTDMTGG
jgi:3-deoxy-D-manno-octulosonate 8-phosphate phosphatase KdsC-like HAD superfamily phosphatase